MTQNYTPEFRKKIVRLHEEEGRTYKSITAEYGVSKASICKWCSELRKECQTSEQAKANYDSIKENLRLKRENEELRKATTFNIDKSNVEFDNLFRKKEIVLHYTENVYVFTLDTVIDEKTVKTTLEILYKFVSLRLTGVKKLSEFEEAISEFQSGYSVDTQDALIVRNKYEQLGLIESFVGKDNVEMIRMTDFGKQIMNELNG